MNIIVCIVHSYEFAHKLHLINVIRYINCIVLVKVVMLYCRFQMLQCSYQEAGMRCLLILTCNTLIGTHQSAHQ